MSQLLCKSRQQNAITVSSQTTIIATGGVAGTTVIAARGVAGTTIIAARVVQDQ